MEGAQGADSAGGAPDTFVSPGTSPCFCLDGGRVHHDRGNKSRGRFPGDPPLAKSRATYELRRGQHDAENISKEWGREWTRCGGCAGACPWVFTHPGHERTDYRTTRCHLFTPR